MEPIRQAYQSLLQSVKTQLGEGKQSVADANKEREDLKKKVRQYKSEIAELKKKLDDSEMARAVERGAARKREETVLQNLHKSQHETYVTQQMYRVQEKKCADACREIDMLRAQLADARKKK